MKNTTGSAKPRTGISRFFNGIGRLFVVVAIAILVIGAAVAAVFTGLSPIVLFAILWFVCAWVAMKDREPWEASRFLGAVLVAWAIDTFLFIMSVTDMPRSYRHFSPAIVVISVLSGYVAWRLLNNHALERNGAESNPFASLVGFAAALFLMYYVISPAMFHLFPHHWSFVSTFTSSDDGHQ
jgi:hypothetical protein